MRSRRGLVSRADGRVYVRGGWIEEVPTLPLEGGVEALARFANRCWEHNIRLNRMLLDLQHPPEGARP